jgi:hypothetical protein
MEYNCRDWRASNLLWKANCDGYDFSVLNIEIHMRILEDAISKWYNHMERY